MSEMAIGAISRRRWLASATALALEQSCKRPHTPAWTRLSGLPLGLGGQFAGVHGGALIVAGGSWFPVSKWAGGAKQWVADVFVLERPGAAWKKFSLPKPLAYGGSASHDRGLLLIGGGDARENRAECQWLRWNGSVIEVEPGPPLPMPLANCGAAVISGIAYAVGGQQSPSATVAERAIFSLDLADKDATWKAEPPKPGPGRILPSVAGVGGSLYVAGGADLEAGPNGAPSRVYLQDAWRLTPGAGWTQIAALPEKTCAAPAFGAGGKFLVLGGSDGVLAPRENELRDAHPGFSRALRIYDPRTNAWTAGPPLPFSLVTTTPTQWNDLLVVPGGEDRPAHRSGEVYALDAREFE